jgi:3-oxoacyl-[acyl-carrier protein] reductase
MGSVDILVNNAGITRDALAMRMSDEDWLSVIEVNLTSTFRLCRAAIRPMMKARWGRIINVTSVVAQAGNPGQVNYAAAKAGVAGLSRSLAQEVASRGITVNCVAPGLVETAMTDKLNDEQRAKILTAVPVGRIGKPEEIAAGVVFLASVEAGYVTGATLDINGGGDML